jgi:hypothetical protein
MQFPKRLVANRLQQHPRVRAELLAVLSIAVMAVLAYTLWPRPAPPTDSSAASAAVSASDRASAVQRQEEMKDQWLERRIGTAGVSKSASAGPVPECDAVCLNAYSQQFRDLQQELNGRPAQMPACNEACLNLYGRQFQDLQYELHGR